MSQNLLTRPINLLFLAFLVTSFACSSGTAIDKKRMAPKPPDVTTPSDTGAGNGILGPDRLAAKMVGMTLNPGMRPNSLNFDTQTDTLHFFSSPFGPMRATEKNGEFQIDAMKTFHTSLNSGLACSVRLGNTWLVWDWYKLRFYTDHLFGTTIAAEFSATDILGDLNFFINDCVVQEKAGNYFIYAIDKNQGMIVVKGSLINLTEAPKKIAEELVYDTLIDVAIHGNRLFLLDDGIQDSIHTYSLTDPASPLFIGTQAIESKPEKVLATSERLFVIVDPSNAPREILVFDTTAAQQPLFEFKFFGCPGAIGMTYLQDKNMLAVSNMNYPSAILFYDLEQPNSYAAETVSQGLNTYTRSSMVYDGFADLFFASWEGIGRIDTNDMVLVTPGSLNNLWQPYHDLNLGAVIDEKTLLMTGWDKAAVGTNHYHFVFVDISNTDEPRLVQTVVPDITERPNRHRFSVLNKNGKKLLVYPSDTGLLIKEIVFQNGWKLNHLATILSPGEIYGDFFFDNNRLVFKSSIYNLRVYDTTDLFNPQLLINFHLPQDLWGSQVAEMDDDLVFLVVENQSPKTLALISIADPGDTKVVWQGDFEPSGYYGIKPERVFKKEQNLFIWRGYYTLLIKYSDTSAVQIAKLHDGEDLGPVGRGTLLIDDLLILGVDWHGDSHRLLEVFDISDPADPVQVMSKQVFLREPYQAMVLSIASQRKDTDEAFIGFLTGTSSTGKKELAIINLFEDF